ncbi:MAG: HPr-rel-A system PqqD family peptide chaperone [Sphingobium sp.]
MAGANRLYRRVDPDTLILRPLDGLTLLYHRTSGQTHLLDSPLPEILAILEPDGCSPAELLVRLSREHETGGDAEAMTGLEAHLEALVSAGLARVA